MKKQNYTITIGRNRNGYYYRDASTEIGAAQMLETFGLLIARLSGTIQADECKNDFTEYEIDIARNTKERPRVKITIGHNGNGYYYSDGSEEWHYQNMMVVFKSLLGILARIVSNDEMLGTDIVYTIEVTKSFIFHKSSD